MSEPPTSDLKTQDKVPEPPARVGPTAIPSAQERLGETELHLDVAATIAGEAEHGSVPAGRSSSPGRGRFTVLAAHAQGGLGLISRAFDEKLRRQVALKEIRADRQGDPELRQRFLTEAEITGQLEHPGIVPIYALDEDEQGQPFYAMRFIQGRTLAEAIRKFHQGQGDKEKGKQGDQDPAAHSASFDSLACRELLQRFVSLCQTLAYAHNKGVIHRDLKPPNVMLGDYGETLVLDWGLAKRVGALEPEHATTGTPTLSRLHTPTPDNALTEVGQILGTPAYMSPEQAEGANVGPASDIYALGAILYELLTGRPPYEGSTLSVWQQVRAGPPAPPLQVRRSAPPALVAVCCAAMARSATERYASAAELAKDVERWLADEPVLAYVEPWTVRAGRWVRRHRTLVVSSAAAMLLVLPILLGATVLLQAANGDLRRANWRESAAKEEAQQREQEARAQKSRADANAERARATVDKFFVRVSKDERLREHALQPLRRQLLDMARVYYEQFVAEAGDAPSLSQELGKTYSHLALITAETAKTDDAIKLNEQAVALHEKLHLARPDQLVHQQDLAEALLALGTYLNRAAQFDQAGHRLSRALGLFEKLDGLESTGGRFKAHQALCLDELGQIAFRTGKLKSAEEAFDKQLAIFQELARAQPASVEYRVGLADSYNSLGTFYHATRRPTQAGTAFQQALALREELAREYPTKSEYEAALSAGIYNLGHFYRTVSQPSEAEEAWTKALDRRERLVMAHPFVLGHQRDLAKSCLTLGAQYQSTGRLEEAESLYTKALDILERLLRADPTNPESHKERVDVLSNLAYLHYTGGRYTAAEDAYRQFFERVAELMALEPMVPAHRNRKAAGHANLGLLYRDTKRFDQAVAAFKLAIGLREDLARDYPAVSTYLADLASSCTNLALVLRDHVRAEESLPWFDRSVQALEGVLAKEARNPTALRYLGEARFGRARAFAGLGRHVEALADFDAALKLPVNLDQRWMRLQRAASLAAAGDHLRAAEAALQSASGSTSGAELRDAARILSLAAAGAQKDEPAAAERHALQAVAFLRRALELGYFDNEKKIANLKEDAGFKALRERKDFKALVDRLK